MRALINYITAI